MATLRSRPQPVVQGQRVTLELVDLNNPASSHAVIWLADGFGEFDTVPGHNQLAVVKTPDGGEVAVSFHAPGERVRVVWETAGIAIGAYPITADVHVEASLHAVMGTALLMTRRQPDESATTTVQVIQEPRDAVQIVKPSMRRADHDVSSDKALWTIIRRSANALSFKNYSDFMEIVMCGGDDRLGFDNKLAHEKRDPVKHRLRLPFPDTDAYRQLKVATEVFVMLNCGVAFNQPRLTRLDPDNPSLRPLSQDPEELAAEQRRHYDPTLQPGGIETLWKQLLDPVGIHPGNTGPQINTLPYLAIIRKKLRDEAIVQPPKWDDTDPARWRQKEEAATECMGILMDKLTHPCLLELIWSYWHEEGMLVQTMNAITWRFQNRRGPADRDPLALLEIDPLRPLNNFIWGYVQDEQHRLTVPRRAYEYDHHYGLTLVGKSVPTVRGADSRSRFLEAFHNLLFRCSIFFKEDDDTTVVADGFPVLNALKEVHLLLTQGAHNQYGDLPWTARQEMLMQEWLLARPEMREFLPSRIMVDYPEEWMDRVETMKTLQGWTDTSVMHFRDLGVFGEQILLSVRFGAWPSVIESQNAANWARYWRPEIQGYIHGYRAVTGADLTDRVDATLPSVLLQQRLGSQRRPGLVQHVVATPIPSNVGQLPPRTTR
jgi:hypothetical protein